MEYDLLLKSANIIDHEGEIKKNCNVYIKNGIINDVTREFDKNKISVNRVLDCTDMFISPGLVNLHTHAAMNIFKGIAEDVNIDDWFNKEIWPYESNMTKDDVYIGTLVAIEEMINNGVTAFADHYMFGKEISKAVVESGIKGDIALTIFGMNDDFEKELEKTKRIIEKKRGKNSRLKLRFGPHAPYTCPDDTLKKIIDTAKELKTGIHIHLSETDKQVLDCLEDYNKTPFQRTAEAGGFDIPCIIAHGLWIKEEDRKLLNNNTIMAACPKTYMKLSSGYGNLWEDTKELPLAIGTDGAASSNNLNPIEQLRLFSLIGKMENEDATDYRLKDMWKILMKGHEALDFNSGKIEKGYAADIVIWDLNKLNTMPLYNPLASIIYSSDSSNIQHTIVDGEILKEKGKVNISDKDLKRELINTSENILKRSKGDTQLNY